MRNNAIPIAIVTAPSPPWAGSIVRAIPTVRAAMRLGDGAQALEHLTSSQPLAAILFPFRLLVAPLFADSTAHWLLAILPAFALMAVHYPWVTRTDAAFEEAVADAAAKRARAIAATRDARRRPAVRAEGRCRAVVPARAHRTSGRRDRLEERARVHARAAAHDARDSRVRRLVIGTAVYSEVGDWSDLAQIGEVLCAIPIVMLVLLGPGFVRVDLRQDLLQLDQLRSYPLRGSMIVAAEIASTALILTAMQFLLLAFAASLASFDAHVPVPLAPAVLIALVALPSLNAISLTVANGAALLFPGWVRLGDGRAAGIEAMGQNVLADLRLARHHARRDDPAAARGLARRRRGERGDVARA